MPTTEIKASYYQQFDADVTKPVPAESYGGWKQATIPVDLERTALVVMHAWDCGTPREYPGWHRAVEYFPRANAICEQVFPPLLTAIRRARMRLFHVVGGGDYYKNLPGYRRAVSLVQPSQTPERIEVDTSLDALHEFRGKHVFVGDHNRSDVTCGFQKLDFPSQARPQGDEGVAENAEQLFALCKDAKVNHLIYVGFAINWCLLMSPGGMLDMSRRSVLCSAIRQGVTAVENKETARQELNKELALWRVALAFGFVFDLDDVLAAVGGRAR
jgi:hypothetical protein